MAQTKAPPLGDAPDEALLSLVRQGNREAACIFVERYLPLLKRRIRGKIARSMRDATDTYDVLSTVRRRLDGAVLKAAIRAESVGQLVAYIGTIADRAVLEKGRVRAQPVSQSGEIHEAESRHAEAGGEFDSKMWINRAMQSAGDEVDRQILWLWLQRRTSTQIAESLNIEAPTVRKRLERIRTRLKGTFGTM